MSSEDKHTIILNIISNMIFQVVFIIISGSGIVYAMKKIIISSKDNTVNVSLFTLGILIVSIIFATSAFLAIVIGIYKKKKKTNDLNDVDDIDDVDDYYFINYEKHLTIYKNGNGIIIHKFSVIINDSNKFNEIRRKLNIEDGKDDSVFPPIKKMMETNISERFDKFGFWYYSKQRIISDVEEFYWQKTCSDEDMKSKLNTKEIRWRFKINKQNIKNYTPYDIIYAISVPGLAPIENGKLNYDSMSPNSDDASSSTMNIDHKIKNLKYIISFEKGIGLESLPECKHIVAKQDGFDETPIERVITDDLFYDKYEFDINSPQFNSDISVTWKYNKK